MYNNNNDLILSEGTHYRLEINKSINDAYVCILICKCRIRFKLPFMPTGIFKLSAYYRHLKEKQCLKALVIIAGTDNRLINITNSTIQSNNSLKRNLSSSRHTTSNKKENVKKRTESSSPSSSYNKNLDKN